MAAYISILDKTSVAIDDITKECYQRLIKMLEEGTPPRAALDIIYLSFSSGYLPEIAKALSEAFTALLEKPFTVSQVLQYKVGNISLSTKLYADAQQVARQTEKIIEDHAKGIQDLRNLALKLYDGYGLESEAVVVGKNPLPKYLKQALGEFSDEVDREVAKLIASGLKTNSLRASYLQLIDRVEAGVAKKQLDKAIYTATQEKLRTLANRIAQTELARTYARAQAKKIKEDTNQYVQIRASGSHISDICDMFIRVDRYGLGDGIYPKDNAPIPPFHPHCRCRQISLVNLVTDSTPDADPNAERKYLDMLSDEERKGILPQGTRKYIENGGSLIDYINQRAPEDYKLLTIGDL